MRKAWIFSILFMFIAVLSSFADDISISQDVDKREVTLDDQVMLTIIVSGNISNIPQPSIPEIKGFTAYSSGRSQNISIINGRVSSAVTFTYILVPTNTGDYTLGPFSISYRGQTYSTSPINIKVLPASTQHQSPPSYTLPSSPDEQHIDTRTETGKENKELFIETYVDKLRAYVNEQITLTFAFYQAVDLFENPVYSPANTSGFWLEDMPPQKKYYKMINGRRYLVTEIKTALFGTSPGEFTIGPARLEASVEDLERLFSRNPFDFDPFSMFKRGKPIILTTEPINVEIMGLPDEGKPQDFKGDVGGFDISAAIDKDTIEENQPVTLKIKISGKGNIKTISGPNMPEITDVKFYDSASSENISKSDYIVQGEKVFEKVIIPKKEGSFIIGPITYTYFDPALERYVKKQINPVTINAIKAKEENVEKGAIMPSISKEEVELLKSDISYIKISSPRFKSSNSYLYKNKMFLLFHMLPLFLLILLYIYEVHRMRLRTDIRYARSARARTAASKRLKEARKIMAKENIKDFYTEIYRAVIEYIGDKLNIPHASLTKTALEERLKDVGADNEIINKMKALFDICDMARFTPLESKNITAFTKDDMHRTLEEASDVISALEKIKMT